MEFKTYKAWNASGYYVMKGEKHIKRDSKGQPLFSSDQVAESGCSLCGDLECDCGSDFEWNNGEFYK